MALHVRSVDARRFRLRLRPVVSEAIRALAYDPAGQALYVRFPDGGLYRYLDVSPQRHRALMSAPSLGTYLNQKIKPNYTVERLG